MVDSCGAGAVFPRFHWELSNQQMKQNRRRSRGAHKLKGDMVAGQHLMGGNVLLASASDFLIGIRAKVADAPVGFLPQTPTDTCEGQPFVSALVRLLQLNEHLR